MAKISKELERLAEREESEGEMYLTVKEAAQLANISEKQVRRLIKNEDVIVSQLGPNIYVLKKSLMYFRIRQNMKYIIDLKYKRD